MTKPNIRTHEWQDYWPLPVVAALGYTASVLHMYSFGPFIGPLQAEFGWSRASVSMGVSIASFAGALLCVPMGLVVDRMGPRRVALVGVPIVACGFGLLGTASGGIANWIALWFVVALGGLAVQPTVWTSAVASRFEVSRGKALAITLAGGSVAAATLPILSAWLIGAVGWRWAFHTIGLLWMFVIFPIVLIGFRGAHDAGGQNGGPHRSSSAVPGEPRVGLREGLRMPVLYKTMIAALFIAVTMIGLVVHFVPILTDQGVAPLRAASVASLIGVASICGRLGTGFLLDRFEGHWVGALGCLLPACVCLLLWDSAWIGLPAAAILLGLALGAEVDVVTYLASRHFGLTNFGALYGALVMALSIGASVGPLIAGALYDRIGHYGGFLALGTILAVISALAFLSIGPIPRRPVRVDEPREAPEQ